MRKHQLIASPNAPTPHPFDLREGMKRWSVLGNEERLEILEPIYDKLQFMAKVLRSGFVQTFVPLVVFLLSVWAVSIWSHPFALNILLLIGVAGFPVWLLSVFFGNVSISLDDFFDMRRFFGFSKNKIKSSSSQEVLEELWKQVIQDLVKEKSPTLVEVDDDSHLSATHFSHSVFEDNQQFMVEDIGNDVFHALLTEYEEAFFPEREKIFGDRSKEHLEDEKDWGLSQEPSLQVFGEKKNHI